MKDLIVQVEELGGRIEMGPPCLPCAVHQNDRRPIMEIVKPLRDAFNNALVKIDDDDKELERIQDIYFDGLKAAGIIEDCDDKDSEVPQDGIWEIVRNNDYIYLREIK